MVNAVITEYLEMLFHIVCSILSVYKNDHVLQRTSRIIVVSACGNIAKTLVTTFSVSFFYDDDWHIHYRCSRLHVVCAVYRHKFKSTALSKFQHSSYVYTTVRRDVRIDS